MDDDSLDADRREAYHCPVHYDNYYDGSGEDANDRKNEEDSNPLISEKIKFLLQVL